MQRIPVFGGRIDRQRFEAIAQIAVKYTGSTPLHITTRQDIELHNVPAQNVSAVLLELAGAGISTFGAGGDSLRNFTLCPACDFKPGCFDVWPLVKLVSIFLQDSMLPLQMPRKFKISFSGCRNACAKPYINDLGFVAQPDGTFTVIGAGSLGPNPQTGIVLYDRLAPQDAAPLSMAALEMFVETGERQNRSKARLRHIREKLGDDEFRFHLDRRLAEKKNSRSWPEISLPKGKNVPLAARVQLPMGNIRPEAALLLAEAMRASDAVLRINLEHGLEIFGREKFDLPDELKPFANRPRIISCPGKTTCTRGIADTIACQMKIADALAGIDAGQTVIAVSGCPNNCAASSVADIGLLGCLKTTAGDKQEAFRVYTAGGNGKTPALAEYLETALAGQIPAMVEKLLQKNDSSDK